MADEEFVSNLYIKHHSALVLLFLQTAVTGGSKHLQKFILLCMLCVHFLCG